MPPASSGTSPRSTDGSDPGFFQMAASALGPGVCGVLCVLFISHSPGSPKSQSCWPSQTDVWGLVFPVQASGLGSQCGALAPCSLGSSSAIENYSFPPFGGCPPRGVGLDYAASHTSYLSCCGSLVSLVVEDLFCWSSVLFLFLG